MNKHIPGIGIVKSDLEQLRFFMRRIEEHESGCWLWTGTINKKTGYAMMDIGGYPRNVLAHRWSHERFIGSIPEGHWIDHVANRGCFHKHCVNPAHLEAVTPSVNTQRHWDNLRTTGHTSLIQ